MDNFNLKYFLAANSCEGFVSYFDKCYICEDGWKAFIIKGGPGTGKSSFMKYIAVKASDQGLKTVLSPCSSDPDSLDAVILPEKRIVIMDGTAPHVVEPSYPGICEEILNFGQFWNSNTLTEKRESILALTQKNKNLHKSASRYIKSAGLLFEDNYRLASAFTDKTKAIDYAKKICKNHLPKQKGNGAEWVRFLCGVTPKGVVSFAETALRETKHRIIIEDAYGAASGLITEYIKGHALENGYEIITIKNPFHPSLLCDHIIIPSLSLSIVREYDFQHFRSSERRIHAQRFYHSEKLHQRRNILNFNKKTAAQLLLSASAQLKEAKEVHDSLEKQYISAMDFAKLTAFAQSFAENLLK